MIGNSIKQQKDSSSQLSTMKNGRCSVSRARQQKFCELFNLDPGDGFCGF